MTPSLMVARTLSSGVRPTRRRWDGTATCSPAAVPRHHDAERRPHGLDAVLAVLRRVRHQQRPTPVMHGLVAADERRFAELCHVITQVCPGAEQ
ncbi:hypothetical protein [Streptomyces murinus]|uniref:hypothetical protein n=1 Tax=Streptomyces murinus TaxID=33900 RepID=UPI00381119CB